LMALGFPLAAGGRYTSLDAEIRARSDSQRLSRK